jgi:hypothetical protein
MGRPPRTRKLHPQHELCEVWGDQASYSSSLWEGPILAQLSGLSISEDTIAAVTRVLEVPGRVDEPVRRAQAERRRRDLAADFASGRIGPDEFMAAIAAIDEGAISGGQPRAPVIDARRVGGYLRDFKATWADPELQDADRAALVQAVYDSIVVRGPDFVAVRLTPAAEAHGFALALPEEVEWVLARPTGVGRALTTYRVPIEGRDEWLAAVRRLA